EHAAARDEVGHSNLLGESDRVLLDREDVSEQEDLGPSRGPGQDRGRHVDADVHARRRRVVLVDHEAVEADLVGELVLGQVALVVRVRLLAVEEPVRELEPERGVLLSLGVGILVVRHLAEVVELHRRTSPPRNSSTWRANSSGCSIGGRWPHLSSTVRVARDRSRRYCSPHSTGTMRSSRPQRISAGLVTRGKKLASRGLCMYGFQVSRAVISRLRTAISCWAGDSGAANKASHSGTVFGSCTVIGSSCGGG